MKAKTANITITVKTREECPLDWNVRIEAFNPGDSEPYDIWEKNYLKDYYTENKAARNLFRAVAHNIAYYMIINWSKN